MTTLASSLLILLLAVSPTQAQERTTLDMTTWSIIAMDPSTGDVGISMASCVPGSFGDGVGALVPGVGVAAVQAFWDLTNRDRVFEAIQEGLSAHQVVDRVTAPEADPMTAQRQYAVITLRDGRVEIAGFTGERAPDWSGIASDTDMVVSAQGNTLVSEAVVGDALDAFRTDDTRGRNSLADRLMRALEAGSAAGGDVRCNGDGITSTAATAMILVACGGDQPYATENIGMTDQGTDAAPWLAISHNTPLEGPNPIIEVRRRFEEWRARLPLDGCHAAVALPSAGLGSSSARSGSSVRRTPTIHRASRALLNGRSRRMVHRDNRPMLM